MTTIIMLPTATPAAARPAPPGGSGGPSGAGDQDRFGPALDRAIDAERRGNRDVTRRDDAGRSDRGARPGRPDAPGTGVRRPAERSAGTTTPGTGPEQDVTGTEGTGTEGTDAAGADRPATVTELVRAAADLLADVGGTHSVPAEGSDAATPDEPIAEVIDLASRRPAALAAGTSPAAAGAAAAGTGQTGLGLVVDGAGAAAGGAPAGAVAGPDVAVSAGAAAVGSTAGTAGSAGTATGTVPPSAVVVDPVAAGEPIGTTARTTGVPTDVTAPVDAAASSSGSTTQTPPAHAMATISGTGHPTATADAAPVPTGSAPTAPGDPRGLVDQLGVRLASLREAGPGQHTLTLRVDPESFGPVRVVAHIGTEGVRIELLGASDQAREALKAALPDLRRDLAAAGLSADLGLGDHRGAALHGQGADADAAANGGPGSRNGQGDPGRPGDALGRTGTEHRPVHHSPVSDRLVGLDLLV